MSFDVMHNLHVLVLFTWLVSILTLSTSDEIKTDGITSLKSSLSESYVDGSSKIEHQTSPSLNPFPFGSVNFTKLLNKNVAIPSVAGEGGPISISTTQETSTTSHLTLGIQSNLSKEEDNISYVKRRKNISKIVSRKGANEMSNMKNENISSTEVTISSNIKSIIEPITVASIVHNNEKIDTNLNNLKSNISDKHINALNITVNNTLYPMNITQPKISTSAPITASVVQEHKPKPTATVIGPNGDKETFIPHNKGSRLGMPKKINYVFPVIITLVAVPVLGAIIFMVYKQGRDCWDKRHYRRMDFLIDGMYND